MLGNTVVVSAANVLLWTSKVHEDVWDAQ